MLSVDSLMMFPNSMISEGLPPYISSSRGLSHMYIEGQKGSFLNNRPLSSDYSYYGSDPGNARSFHRTAQESKLAHVQPKIGPNPTIQCDNKLPIDFTVGKIRPLVKGIFNNATLPTLL